MLLGCPGRVSFSRGWKCDFRRHVWRTTLAAHSQGVDKRQQSGYQWVEDRHPSKEVREALAAVEREGWTIVRRSGHSWALIRCPRGCCQLSVFATPQNSGNYARRIVVRRRGARRFSKEMAETGTYSFTLVIEGTDLTPPDVIDALYEAGCRDALFGSRGPIQLGEFDREASSLAEAVMGAIEQVESVRPLRVVRVEPDELVSASAIAARAGRTRESVRLLVEGRRGPGGFPAPVACVDAKTRLWRWSDVARWLRDVLGDGVPAGEGAAFLAALNAALELRARVSALETAAERRAVAGVLRGEAVLHSA